LKYLTIAQTFPHYSHKTTSKTTSRTLPQLSSCHLNLQGDHLVTLPILWCPPINLYPTKSVRSIPPLQQQRRLWALRIKALGIDPIVLLSLPPQNTCGVISEAREPEVRRRVVWQTFRGVKARHPPSQSSPNGRNYEWCGGPSGGSRRAPPLPSLNHHPTAGITSGAADLQAGQGAPPPSQ
jgi:hypothetical protein